MGNLCRSLDQKMQEMSRDYAIGKYKQIQVISMKDIQGCKPRKFITRTILTNPSLISVSVTSLLDPENNALPKIYQALEKRQKLVSDSQSRIFNELSPQKFARQASLNEKVNKSNRQRLNVMDSLQQAEKQFMSRKMSQQLVSPVSTSNQATEVKLKPATPRRSMPKELSYMSRGSSTPSLFINNFNYQRSGQIKQKQSKLYNIITNLA